MQSNLVTALPFFCAAVIDCMAPDAQFFIRKRYITTGSFVSQLFFTLR